MGVHTWSHVIGGLGEVIYVIIDKSGVSAGHVLHTYLWYNRQV